MPEPLVERRTLGVMQPYLFPYVGYFQYILACDRFILYDDVQFIMRGWINRNNLLLNGAAHLFTVPLLKASPNKLINETELLPDHSHKKLLATMAQAYGKAPQWAKVKPLLEAVLEAGDKTISALAARSIIGTCEYLGLPTEIIPSSAPFNNQALARNERLWDLCRQTGSNCCVVPMGGSALYDKEEFRTHGIDLLYLTAALNPYPQGHLKAFVPSLSILDMLMWCEKEEARALLAGYTLT